MLLFMNNTGNANSIERFELNNFYSNVVRMKDENQLSNCQRKVEYKTNILAGAYPGGLMWLQPPSDKCQENYKYLFKTRKIYWYVD